MIQGHYRTMNVEVTIYPMNDQNGIWHRTGPLISAWEGPNPDAEDYGNWGDMRCPKNWVTL